MNTRPRYSVVITAHNEERGIRACLLSLKEQIGIGPGELEIVLVDDRSTDGTVAEANAAGIEGLRSLRVDHLQGDKLTARQYALDLGFRAARGDVILTSDADGIAEKDWVVRTAGPILKGQADAVAGAVAFGPKGKLIAQFQTVDVAFYLMICRLLSALGFEAGILFGDCAFIAGLYPETGGFEHIGYALTEDLAFARALRRSGKRVFYIGGQGPSVQACADWGHLIERAKRISAGGTSALSAVLAGWMLSLAVFLGAALFWGGPLLTLLALVRYGVGVVAASSAILHAKQFRLFLLTFFYEPVTIIIGFLVLCRLIIDRRVEWGGVGYRR